jgi:hypothetical protein
MYTYVLYSHFLIQLQIRYKRSFGGWKERKKRKEMTQETSRYLITYVNDKPVAFTHFQFDMDYGRQVLYWYVKVIHHVDNLSVQMYRHVLGLHYFRIVQVKFSRIFTMHVCLVYGCNIIQTRQVQNYLLKK